MKAGKYYVSDPCYLVKENEWGEFCDQLDNGNDEVTLKNGAVVTVFGTAYGDGCYFDQAGRKYPVDAGLIGIIPFDAVPVPEKNQYITPNVIDFPADFSCSEKNGVMTFGHIVINTGDVQ